MGIQLLGMGIEALDWTSWLATHLPTLVVYALIAWTFLVCGTPFYLAEFGWCEDRLDRDAGPMDELRAASDRRAAQILAERAEAQARVEGASSTEVTEPAAADASGPAAPPPRAVNARPSTRGPSTRGPSTRGPSTRPPRGG